MSVPNPRLLRATLGAAAAVVLAVTLQSPGAMAADQSEPAGQNEAAVPPSQIRIGSTVLASGLDRLTAIAAPDDGSDRLLIAEKPGRLRVFRIGQGLDPRVYLDISDRVSTAGNERGLLGVATSPDFATTRTLIVAYTRVPDGAVTLSAFRLEQADQSFVPADTEEVLLTQEHGRFSNHNGGQVAFGPDGMLYWSIGDGGGGGDPLRSAQRLDTLLGKIVRIDVLGECVGNQGFCVPPDNPFVDRPGAREEIWAFGLRNPWRFSFDRDDGSLWIGDVGQNRLEEIDHLRPGRAGANLGWSCLEGDEVFNPDQCGAGNFVAPVFTYPTQQGCAVTGGFVYRGERFADVAAGTYVLTDYCSGTAWGIGEGEAAVIGSLPVNTTTFGEDQSGELYVATDRGQLHAVTFTLR